MIETVLVSFAVSAVTTILITTKVKMDILRYVDEVCEINIDQVEKVKNLSLSTIEKITEIIKQEGDEHHV